MTWYCYLQSLHIRTEQLNYWKKNSQNILHVLSEFVTFGGSTFIGVLGCMKSEGCIFGGRTIDRTKWQREIHSLPWGFGMGHLSLWSSRHWCHYSSSFWTWSETVPLAFVSLRFADFPVPIITWASVCQHGNEWVSHGKWSLSVMRRSIHWPQGLVSRGGNLKRGQ